MKHELVNCVGMNSHSNKEIIRNPVILKPALKAYSFTCLKLSETN